MQTIVIVPNNVFKHRPFVSAATNHDLKLSENCLSHPDTFQLHEQVQTRRHGLHIADGEFLQLSRGDVANRLTFLDGQTLKLIKHDLGSILENKLFKDNWLPLVGDAQRQTQVPRQIVHPSRAAKQERFGYCHNLHQGVYRTVQSFLQQDPFRLNQLSLPNPGINRGAQFVLRARFCQKTKNPPIVHC